MADPGREGARSRGACSGAAGVASSSGLARSPESSASPGAARSWLSPIGAPGRGRVVRSAELCAPSPRFPGSAARPTGQSDRPLRLRSLLGVRSAFRALSGSLCKPSGVGRTAREAAGLGSPGAQVLAWGFSTRAVGGSGRPSGRSPVCLHICGRTGCSKLTTWINLGVDMEEAGKLQVL